MKAWRHQCELPQDTILDEAKKLVYGDRGADYGHPIDDFARQAMMLNGLFRNRLKEGEVFTPLDIPLISIIIKMSRLQQSPLKKDHPVDIAGYAETLSIVQDRMTQIMESDS